MARGGVLSPRGAKSSKSFTALVRHVPSVLDVIKLDLSFRKRIQMLSNSSGLLRYGPETVLSGLERFLPPVWAFNPAGHSRRFASTSHLDILCACSICRNFGRRHTHFRHKKLPSFFSTDIWAFLIAFWVFTIALVVFEHVPVLLRNNLYILRADLKCAILETGRDTTFGALLESLGATNISGFVATALI